ncbi:MAG: DUF885 family protein [Pirellulales bacterium]
MIHLSHNRWFRNAAFSLAITSGFNALCDRSSDLLAADPTETTTTEKSTRSESDVSPSLADMVEQFSADINTLNHRFRIPLDEAADLRRSQMLDAWMVRLKRVPFSTLSQTAKVDYLLLRSEIDYRRRKLESDRMRDQAATEYLPYAPGLVELCRKRENVEPAEPEKLADALNKIAVQAEEVAAELSKSIKGDGDKKELITTEKRLSALRAAQLLESLQRTVGELNRFYSGYDPLYTWWAAQPIKRLEAALTKHRTLLREKIVGVPESDKETILGLPIGDEGLKLELEHEWIALSTDELIRIADEEMKWCDEQMSAASRELGFGDDWRKAMAHVKEKHVAPGEQPQMIRDLAWEAIRFLETHDLLTVPPMAADGWRMIMMTPEAQRVNPYFLGGDSIIVSFPTDSMTHEEKLMSMRSNNVHFSRATVHHELIPGHHLQYHMLARHKKYREIFNTPFWMEGWALYWEMMLWDMDFARNAEDRVGMLFWRRHRCARIVFSLSYHSGKMTPEECVEYLVERVGHERSAAAAEVRRSIMGDYGPLYQAAYMLGGLQIRTLHRELVQSGKLSNREFHDRILQQNSIPIEALRIYMTDQPVDENTKPSWKFGR